MPGDWLDLGERILTGALLQPGDNVLSFATAPTAVAGRTFARFRFSTEGRLQPTGLAGDGEVEDHEITISPGGAAGAGFDVVGGSVTGDKSIADPRAHEDIMAQGLDLAGELTFAVSEPALRIATGLNWNLADAENAMLGYYLDHLIVSGGVGGAGEGLITGTTFFDGLFEPGAPFPRIDGGQLLIRSTARGFFWTKRDFGKVLVDGKGGQSGYDIFDLLNLGDEDLTVLAFTFQAEGADFVITPVEPGTVIPAKRGIAVRVIFDPERVGAHAATLRVQHDGLNSPTGVDLLGFGLSPVGDIMVDQHQEMASALTAATSPTLLEDARRAVQSLDVGKSFLTDDPDIALGGAGFFTLRHPYTLVSVETDGPFMREIAAIDLRKDVNFGINAASLNVVGDLLLNSNDRIGLIGGGFPTVDISDPAAPVIISNADRSDFVDFPTRDLANTGARRAVLVGDTRLNVLDISDPAATDRFLFGVPLPPSAEALALASGVAYVANGAAGLLVVRKGLRDENRTDAKWHRAHATVERARPDLDRTMITRRQLLRSGQEFHHVAQFGLG